jgi:hypothetical protein
MRSDTIRRTPASDLEVLLVTSRGKGNRILPKDQVKPGKTAAALVVEELYEEAGARGTIGQALVARCDFPLIESGEGAANEQMPSYRSRSIRPYRSSLRCFNGSAGG